jgi:aminocarboxymuconate-semialdehyde decarboxylase
MKRQPGLTVCLPHGGGFLPFQRGRLEHACRAQPQARRVLGDDPPGPYLDRLYADSILFSPQALRFLVQSMGADHVLLGSDYPFGMGVDDPVAAVTGIPGLSEPERQAILGGSAARLLRLDLASAQTLRA